MVAVHRASEAPSKGRVGYSATYVAEIQFRKPPENGMFIYVNIPAGTSTQPHAHETLEEVFVILSKTKMQVADSIFDLNEGDVVLVEPGEPHSFIAPNEHGVRIIAMKFPNLSEDKVELEHHH